MKYPTTKPHNNMVRYVDNSHVCTPKNDRLMKSIKTLILFALCLPIILFIICFAVQPASASNHKPHDGPVVKIEVTCKYVSLYSIKSDTVATTQRRVFPKGSVLSISGEDKNSTAKTIYVTVNQTEEELYKEPIKLIAKGRHTIKIRALDKDNNETMLSITYLIVE